jgi:transcriptional regulator with XRE-family HTH domain
MKKKLFNASLLKAKMASKGYSVYDFRDELLTKGVKVTVQTIYGWLGGKFVPNGLALSALCEIFDVTAPEWFVDQQEVDHES